MRSKFEAWISKLGCEVDATKVAWRFDAIKVRSLDSEAWMRGGCDEVTKPEWRFDVIEVRSLGPWVPILDSGNWMRRSKRGGQLGIRCY